MVIEGIMKKFFTITGYLILGVILCLYLAFLFYLPRKIDLNTYKPDIQKLVKATKSPRRK